MYPKPVDFKFNTDSYKFIAVLAVIAVLGFIYTSVTKAYRGLSASDIALDSLDLLTIVVPPALPAAMTVGIMLATRRLKVRF
jgi:cation-transporting ATPase 13A3/4/5